MKGMGRFFLKTALLISLLFCAVLYGMDIAKQGMVKMEGNNNQARSSSLFDFKIPGLAPGASNAENEAEAAELKTKSKTNQEDIESRLAKLDHIHGFNPYSAMGDKLSDGVSSVFEKGITAAATVVNQLLN